METPVQNTVTIQIPEENLLQLLLDEKKDMIAAVRAGKPISSVPTIGERIQQKKKHG